jgi:hypothetical protein
MTPEARAGLQALAYALPPGSAVAVPREWLLELLNHSGVTHEQSGARRDADFTVVDLAERFGRKASTVRGWLERGVLTGAYRFQGRGAPT